MPVAKDEQRIYDIRSKARDINHARRLATTQANRITDIPKCRRRFEAAQEMLGYNHPVTIAFERRYNALTGQLSYDIPTPPSTTNISVDIDLTNTQRSKEDKQKNVDKLKEKISTGKAARTVDEYIAFFRK